MWRVRLDVHRDVGQLAVHPNKWSANAQALLPVPEYSARVDQGDPVTDHALMRALRAVGEHMALKAAVNDGAQRIVDIGANVSRHMMNRPRFAVENMSHIVCRGKVQGDQTRYNNAVHLREREHVDVRVGPLTATNCAALLQGCDAALMVHSHYYFNDALLDLILQHVNALYVVYTPCVLTPRQLAAGVERSKHKMTLTYNGAVEYSAECRGGMCWAKAMGNPRPYQHPCEATHNLPSCVLFEYTEARDAGTAPPPGTRRGAPKGARGQAAHGGAAQPHQTAVWIRVARFVRVPPEEPTLDAALVERMAAQVVTRNHTRNVLNNQLHVMYRMQATDDVPTNLAAAYNNAVMAAAVERSNAMAEAVADAYDGAWTSRLWRHGRALAMRLTGQRPDLTDAHVSIARTQQHLDNAVASATPDAPRASRAVTVLAAVIAAALGAQISIGVVRGLDPRPVLARLRRYARAARVLGVLLALATLVSGAAVAARRVGLLQGETIMMRETARAVDREATRPDVATSCGPIMTHPDVVMTHGFECEANITSPGAVAVGPGLPVQVIVYHTCARTSSSAIIDRVLEPHQPVDPVDEWPRVYRTPMADSSIVSFPRDWVERYIGGKRLQKEAGLATTDRIDFTRAGQVKRENTAGQTEVDMGVGCRAGATIGSKARRWITSCTPEVSGLYGPYACAYMMAALEACNVPCDVDGVHVRLAIGVNAREISRFISESFAEVAVHGGVVMRGADFGRFDARVQAWMNTECLADMARVCRIAPRDHARMAADINTTELRTPHLRARWTGRRRSGDDITTVWNTLINRAFWRLAYERAGRDAPRRMRVIVGGDDSLVLCSEDGAFQLYTAADQLSDELGFALELEDDAAFPTFYSHYVMRIHPEQGFPDEFALMPKIGKTLVSLSYTTTTPDGVTAARRFNDRVRGSADAWRNIPCLREIVGAVETLGLGANRVASDADAHRYNLDYDAGWSPRPFANEYLAAMGLTDDELTRVGLAYVRQFGQTHHAPVVLDIPPRITDALIKESGFTERPVVTTPSGPRVLVDTDVGNAISVQRMPAGNPVVLPLPLAVGLIAAPTAYLAATRPLAVVWMAALGWLLYRAGCDPSAVTLAPMLEELVPSLTRWATGSPGAGMLAKVALALLEAKYLYPSHPVVPRVIIHTLMSAPRAYSSKVMCHAGWNAIASLMMLLAARGRNIVTVKQALTTMAQKRTQNSNAVAARRAPKRPTATRASPATPAPKRARLAAPTTRNDVTTPAQHCANACRVNPFDCPKSCARMGVDLGACRNPVGARPSQTRYLDYQLSGVADATGLAVVRVQPTLKSFINAMAGTVNGSTHADVPNYAELTGMAQQYRLCGWGVDVMCTQPNMANGGTIYVGNERPAVNGDRPSNGTSVSAAYIRNLVGSYSGKFAGGARLVGDLGSANAYRTVDGTGVNVPLTIDTATSYANVSQDPTTVLQGNLSLGELMDAVVIRIDGAAANASFNVRVVYVAELVNTSRYAQYDPVPTTVAASPLPASDSAGARLADLAAHAGTVASGAWRAVKWLTGAASRVPGLADAAAVASDAEGLVDLGIAGVRALL